MSFVSAERQGKIPAASIAVPGSASPIRWLQHSGRRYFTKTARAASRQSIRVCADLSDQLAGALQIQLKYPS